jgi:iron-sulfur cluster repair protein YtfE (RIC family)
MTMEAQKTTQFIMNYFAADHDRLDTLFMEFARLKRRDFPKAKEYFKDFLRGLKRHIVWEEDVLFPLFENKTGMRNSGPTAVMRQEHRLIGAALEELHGKVRLADPDCDAEADKLLDLLGQHNAKEETVLYPTLDQLIRSEEAAAAFHEMENIPAERYNTCCGAH